VTRGPARCHVREYRARRPCDCEASTTRRTQTSRRQALICVELVYAALSLAAAVALILGLGPVANATNQTSVRILGAALLSLAVGALAAARDPVGNRVMLPVEITFTTLSALALVWKLVVDHGGDRTLVLLAPLVVCVVLLLALSPAARPEERHGKAPRRDPRP
jgi:predicted anti-sigma-YlaC factor YlaD